MEDILGQSEKKVNFNNRIRNKIRCIFNTTTIKVSQGKYIVKSNQSQTVVVP